MTTNTKKINEIFICKYCEKQLLIFISPSKCVFQSLNLGTQGDGMKTEVSLENACKSSALHSTLWRPILLSNSNCHPFYLNLVEAVMLRLRTVWKRPMQIPLPILVHALKKSFCSDGYSSQKFHIICTSYMKYTLNKMELLSATQFHIYLNSIKVPWHTKKNMGVNR